MTQLLKNKSKWKLVIQASLCCFLWATAIPTLKVSYQLLDISADDIYNRLVLAGIRFMLAGIIIGIFAYFKEGSIPKVKRSLWPMILVFALLNTTLQYLFFYVGVANTTAIKGVLIDSVKPLMVVVLAHFMIRGDHLTKNKVLGIILGMTGVIITSINSISENGIDLAMSFYGEGFLIFASIVYSLAVIYGRHVMKKISSISLNMYQFIVGATILLIIGLVNGQGFHLEFNVQAIILLIYSSFLSAVAFTLWYSLIFKYGASSVSVFSFLVPVFGSIISSIIFVEEEFTINILLGLIFMSLSIYLVNKNKKPK